MAHHSIVDLKLVCEESVKTVEKTKRGLPRGQKLFIHKVKENDDTVDQLINQMAIFSCCVAVDFHFIMVWYSLFA